MGKPRGGPSLRMMELLILIEKFQYERRALSLKEAGRHLGITEGGVRGRLAGLAARGLVRKTSFTPWESCRGRVQLTKEVIGEIRVKIAGLGPATFNLDELIQTLIKLKCNRLPKEEVITGEAGLHASDDSEVVRGRDIAGQDVPVSGGVRVSEAE